MVSPLARALSDDGRNRRPVYLIPCTVTQVSPLLVDLGDGTPIQGVKIAGATYTLGAANALVFEGSTPIVLPIGAP